MRHSHPREPAALSSQRNARWRVDAVLGVSINVWPAVKEMHSKARNCVRTGFYL